MPLSLRKIEGVKNTGEQRFWCMIFFLSKSISLGVPYKKINSSFAQSCQIFMPLGFFSFFQSSKTKRDP